MTLPVNRPTIAKLSPPRLVDIAPRERLFQRLDEVGRGGVAWVTAPAGSGKTSLVASYLTARGLVPLWYTIDARDEDVASLFEALASFVPEKAAGLPRFGVESFAALAAFARRFFEALYRALPERSVLVFDDYHELVEDSAFHELARCAIATLPPERRVVFISRSAPPRSLTREIVHGIVRSLDPGELVLTREEAREVGRMRGWGMLSAAAIDVAHARAEGWVAGFLLLLDPASAHGPLNQSALFDYFEAEVVGKMSLATQRALFAAALLPVFDDRALASLAGADAAGVDTRHLARAGLFLVTQSVSRGAAGFRFHALFREFLQERLPNKFSAAERMALEQRAASLCEELGHHDEAVALYARAGEFSSAARVIAQHAPELFARGQCRTLLIWLGRLPNEFVARDGWLRYWRATAGPFVGAPPASALDDYAGAYRCFEAAGDPIGCALATAGSIQAVVFEGRDFRALDEPMRRLSAFELGALPLPPELELQIVSSMVLALSFREGEVPGIDAGRWLSRALELAAATNSVSQRMMVLGQLLFYRALRGEMAETVLLGLRVERAREEGDAEPLAAATVFLARSLTAWLEADEDACIAAAEQGLAICEAAGVTALRDVLLVYATFGALGKEDRSRVQSYLKQLGHLADTGRPLDSGNYHALVAWAALERADLPAARLALEKSEAASRALGGGFGLALNRLLAAQVEFASGDPEASGACLAEVVEVERRLGNPGLLYWRKLVEADLAASAGDLAASDRALREAFTRGRELGIYNALWPERRRLSELCVRALDQSIEPEYARRLAQRRKLVFARAPRSPEAWPFRLDVRLFGTLAVFVDGRQLSFGAKLPKVPLSLLIALVLLGHDGRELSVELLTDQLWPDAEADAGLHSFETALYRLRKLLGDESLIRLEAGLLRLDPATLTSDYGACLAALARVESAQHEQRPAPELLSDVARLQAAQSQTLLEGWQQPWIIAARERLRRRLEAALDKPTIVTLSRTARSYN